MLTHELREYAETPDRFAPITEGSSVTRYDDGRVCFIQGEEWGSVSSVSIEANEVEQLVHQVRRLARSRNYVWWIGPSSHPSDLPDRLQALGFTEPRDRVGMLHAVALTDEPRANPPEISVTRIATFEDWVAAREVQWGAFDTPQDRREAARARLREDFEESIAMQVPVAFLARLDGRPAGTAMAVPSARGVYLIAGAVATWARGRGLYRALVRARWDFAVARGTPALVTQADPASSYPILKRVGFEDVCTIRRLEDPKR
jgi:acetyltransferase (GNAT) family protein